MTFNYQCDKCGVVIQREQPEIEPRPNPCPNPTCNHPKPLRRVIVTQPTTIINLGL